MTIKTYNFNAGPSVLAKSVLEKAQAELLDYHGSGMSIMEMSHRSAPFGALMEKVERDMRQLAGIPENYKILLLQGGASLQFSMVPMNLIPKDGSADYIIHGVWGQKALIEAKRIGNATAAATSEQYNFDCVPDLNGVAFDPNASYVHYTSNETIQGVQWKSVPATLEGVPVICDMSSDIFSKPINVEKYGMIYGGAQKNAGPSGVTIVIIREDLLKRSPAHLGPMLNYQVQAEKNSLFNTPPSFSIYMLGLVLEWLNSLGGLESVAKQNEEKAALLYNAIDNSGGFYRGHSQVENRSLMNVTFRMPSVELESAFASEALVNGFVGLKGHRSVGGLRASIYNACPVESINALTAFMAEFQNKNQ